MQAISVGRLAPSAVPMERTIGVNNTQTAWLLATFVKMQQMMLMITMNMKELLPSTSGVTMFAIQAVIPVSSEVNGAEIDMAAASRKIIFQETFCANN